MGGELHGTLTGTRRNFIRGVAAAGASTVAAAALQRAGALDLFADTAVASKPTAFSEFEAIAASAADAFEAPAGYRADVLISYGDKFADTRGNVFTYGYNNDFLAFFPLGHDEDEGLLFVNHEYTAPFYLHGYKPGAEDPNNTKSRAEIDLERSTIGNSILHIRRRHGVWKVVSPSRYNKRIYAGEVPGVPAVQRSLFEVTGPLRGDPKVGTQIWGTIGNCSGGTTPWGTAISCEENFDGYGLPVPDPAARDFVYGWADPTNDGFPGYPDYHPDAPYRTTGSGFNKYGWVCEHDPYDPDSKPRKHTALGRFRHENTAFRHVPGKKFVLYMGDDATNDCVYKFISAREYKPGDRANNLKILEEGTLYVARWEPEGRRRFATSGDVEPLTKESGTGTWLEIPVSGLRDTRNYIAATYGPVSDPASENALHFATNRPEDVEVGPDGEVYVAFTNNSSVRDVHGSVRKVIEEENDPLALSFVWTDYASGGPKEAGGQGFSSPDNLVFDSQENLWVVTDISSGTLNDPGPLQYHANNALFMVPTQGPNAGVAFRFANMPVEAEGTGPYFSPDESTLFVNVQHPGEESGQRGSPAVFGQPETYSSWWPRGNKTAGLNPSEPLPSTVAITKLRRGQPGSPTIPGPEPEPDHRDPRVTIGAPSHKSLDKLLSKGVKFDISVDEAATLRVALYGWFPRRSLKHRKPRRKLRLLDREREFLHEPGEVTVKLRPHGAARVLLRRKRSLDAVLRVSAEDAAGNETTKTVKLQFS